MFSSSAFAQSIFGGGAGGDGGMLMSLLPFVLIFVIMYFLILRPQQKRVKMHQEMVKNVRRGDTVVTNGGLISSSCFPTRPRVCSAWRSWRVSPIQQMGQRPASRAALSL